MNGTINRSSPSTLWISDFKLNRILLGEEVPRRFERVKKYRFLSCAILHDITIGHCEGSNVASLISLRSHSLVKLYILITELDPSDNADIAFPNIASNRKGAVTNVS